MMEKKSALGLDGFDPVTIFEGPGPQRGKFEVKLKLDGMTYLFLNVENRGRFKRNSSNFLPQFGGHCAFACGLYGGLLPGTMEHRKLVSGKLYLFSSPRAIWFWEKFPKLIMWGHNNYAKKFKIKTK